MVIFEVLIMDGNLEWSFAILFYPFYGMYPDEGKVQE